MPGRLNAWLLQPLDRGKGNSGLFRVAYSLFYLWHLSFVRVGLLAAAPDENWQPPALYAVLGRPPEWLPGLVEPFLAGLLVLLLFGVWTRQTTLLVWIIGFLLDGFVQSFGKVEHATVLLTFYIPLIMSFSDWGRSYSVDALRSSHSNSGEPASQSGWPQKLVLMVLSFLFLTAGISKIIGGHWTSDPDFISNLIARSYYRSAVEGLAANPFAGMITHSESLQNVARVAVPAFECLFVLVLLGPTIRNVYIRLALVFHALNAMLLGVTFTPVLIAYGVAIDWRRLLKKFRRRFRTVRPVEKWRLSPSRLYALALGTALALGLDWNVTGLGRHVFNLGGLLDWLTIWYVVAPAALVSLTATAYRFVARERRDGAHVS